MSQKMKKGYSSVSTVDEDSNDDDDNNKKKRKSMKDMLKSSAHRRQRQNDAKKNKLPPLPVDDDSDEQADNNNNDDTNPPSRSQPQTNSNNIGNIPGSSGSVTDCMNKSWKICSLFGIEIHIHILLPIFFIASFLIWSQLILKDMANTTSYILLILLFNISLWETILIVKSSQHS